MRRKEFISYLKANDIKYKVGKKKIAMLGNSVDLSSLTSLPEVTVFKNSGAVDLSSLTSLPEGTVFKNSNSVYLSSLTSLPEGTVFKNSGSVDLSSLTSLPEGTVFKNSDSVYLGSLTSLPEGTVFKNSGSVYLGSLTSLPEGTVFKNSGSVYLGSLSGKHEYLGKLRRFMTIDGSTMIVDSKKKKEGLTIIKARYFQGGKIEDMTKSFIAKIGEFTSHGETAREAIEDVNFKKLSQEFDIDELVSKIKEAGKVTVNDYRLITGACRQGCKVFLKQNGVTKNSMSIKKALKLTNGAYGFERFREALAQ